MPTIDDIRRANLGLLVEEFGSLRALAAKLDKSESQISQWVNASADSRSGKPRRISTDSCRAVEQRAGKPVGWMDEQHASAGLAQLLSLAEADDDPSVLWGDIVNAATRLKRFWVTLPDDSMSPRAPSGKRVLFDTALQPRAGDGVLVTDGAGAVYFRIYRAGPSGRWTAHALNPAFADLDSERDGLQVLAVLAAEDGRWS